MGESMKRRQAKDKVDDMDVGLRSDVDFVYRQTNTMRDSMRSSSLIHMLRTQ